MGSNSGSRNRSRNRSRNHFQSRSRSPSRNRYFSPRPSSRSPTRRSLSPRRQLSPRRPLSPRSKQLTYSPKNKNQKYKETITFRFLAPSCQAQYIRDCSKRIFEEQCENHSIT